MPNYEVIKGFIQGKRIGEIVEMDEKLAKRYGKKYLKISGKAPAWNDDIDVKASWDEIKEAAGTKLDKLSAATIQEIATEKGLDILKEDGKNNKSKKDLMTELDAL